MMYSGIEPWAQTGNCNSFRTQQRPLISEPENKRPIKVSDVMLLRAKAHEAILALANVHDLFTLDENVDAWAIEVRQFAERECGNAQARPRFRVDCNHADTSVHEKRR